MVATPVPVTGFSLIRKSKPGMRTSNISTHSARTAASEVLYLTDPSKGSISSGLNQGLAKTSEKQKCLDLVYGTLRNGRLINTIIAHFGRCPVRRISKRLLSIVRPAVYELVFCPDAPDYAVVNEAVNSARRYGGRKSTGFVNAVLRSIERHIKVRQTKIIDVDTQAVVRVGTDTGCLFDEPFLPHPQTESAEYLSQSFSLPPWMINKWLAEFSMEDTMEVAQAGNRRPGIYLRVNLLNCQQAALLDELREHKIQCESLAANMIRVHGAGDVTGLPGFRQGQFTVQDLCAAGVVPTFAPQKNEAVFLDLCAAPGTKTTHLAEVTGDRTTIVATDIQAERLANVRDNIHRLGLQSVRVLDYDKVQDYVQQHGLFDGVLLDVPCSNTGVMARRPEIRYRLHQGDIDKLTRTQAGLLDKAVAFIKPNGRLCYSTCSILEEENQDQVKAFLAKYPAFILAQERLTLPTVRGPDHDGGYVAVLERRRLTD